VRLAVDVAFFEVVGAGVGAVESAVDPEAEGGVEGAVTPEESEGGAELGVVTAGGIAALDVDVSECVLKLSSRTREITVPTTVAITRRMS
jgi:hypothetical protein